MSFLHALTDTLDWAISPSKTYEDGSPVLTLAGGFSVQSGDTVKVHASPLRLTAQQAEVLRRIEATALSGGKVPTVIDFPVGTRGRKASPRQSIASIIAARKAADAAARKTAKVAAKVTDAS